MRAALIAFATQDARVVAAAEVGSLTNEAGDRWSDLDLTFGLAEDVDPRAFLEDWTVELAARWDAVRLFDLMAGVTLYRVFLFPGILQVDLSATAGAVAKTSPRFNLLFGEAVRDDTPPGVDAAEIFGLCVHHALRARVNIERGRLWAAEYWISELRHETLSLAALRRGLPAKYARGFHGLPDALTNRVADSLVSTVAVGELNRALSSAVDALMEVADGLDQARRMEESLRELARG